MSIAYPACERGRCWLRRTVRLGAGDRITVVALPDERGRAALRRTEPL